MSIEYGTAAARDLPQLVALLGMLFAQEHELAPDEAKQTRALQKILSDESSGRVYVARDSGRVVGMAALHFSVSTAEGGLAASFEDFIVEPGQRGRGVGAALLTHVIGEARKLGVLRIMLLTDHDNERAQALYRKLGFAPSNMKAMRLKL